MDQNVFVSADSILFFLLLLMCDFKTGQSEFSAAWASGSKTAVKIKPQVKYLQQPLLLASEVLLYI